MTRKELIEKLAFLGNSDSEVVIHFPGDNLFFEVDSVQLTNSGQVVIREGDETADEVVLDSSLGD